MKKNFFKKLSFVMALAMTVSLAAPAAGVFAAAKPVLNASSKTLLLGTTDRNDFDFNVKNKVSGSKYSWKSDNKAVATVDKNGVTTAAGVGSAKVSVVITKKDGKKVTLSAKVVVKDNIKDITEVYLQTKDAAADKLAVNTEYDFGRKFVTNSGSTTKTTAVTRWFVDSDKATVDNSGVFKATAAGTYKLTAVAFQSAAKYDAWAALKDTTSTVNVLATKTIELKVANSFKVDQLSATEAKLTFAAPMESVSTNDITVSSLVAATSTKVKQTVKSIVLSDDKKSATVTMYTNFAADTTYVFDYTEMESQKFVGAKADLANVTDMVISTSTMTADCKSHKIDVKLLDKNGVDLATIDANLLSRVTFSSSSLKVYCNANTLTFFTVGDTTDVTAVFHTYSYDTTTGKELNTITKTATITGVAEDVNSLGSITAWTIAKTPDWNNLNKVIAAGDSNSGTYKMFVKAVRADGKAYEVSNAPSTNKAFKFESSDPSVLIVGTDGTLYPVKAGNATVIVSFCENTAVINPVYTVIGAPVVNVSADRVATTLKLDTQAFTLSNTTKFTDSKDVTLKVLDQYGAEMTVKDVSLKENNNNYNGTDPINTNSVATTATKLTFVGNVSGTSVTPGTYYYTLSANGLTNYIAVTVNAPSDNKVVAYKLSVGSTFDAEIKDNTTKVSADIKVIGYAANGVALEEYASDAAVSGAGLSVVAYKPDGTTMTLPAGNPGYAYSVAVADGTVSGAAVQLDKGTYSLRLFKGNQYLDGTTFTVTNSQVAPTISVNKYYADSTCATLLDAVKDCVTVTDKDGKPVTDITLGDVIGSGVKGATTYVKTVKYQEKYGNAYVEFTLNVNANITY